MKRKLILISLIVALLCGIFAFAVFAADNDSTDAVEKKKLSEFTDEELYELFADVNLDYEKYLYYKENPVGFLNHVRLAFSLLEEKAYQCCQAGDYSMHILWGELQWIFEDYYGTECAHPLPCKPIGES